MLLSTQEIQNNLKKGLSQKAAMLSQENKLGKLISIVIGENPEQDSYVKIKKRVGEEVGIIVEKASLPIDVTQSRLLWFIQNLANSEHVSGVIIQQPVPKHINLHEVYSGMPSNIEIEGHKTNSSFIFPLVQACMIGLQLTHEHEVAPDIAPNAEVFGLPFICKNELTTWLKTKNITIAGNGMTTGWQIAKYLKFFDIPFNQTNSKTDNPDQIYRNSDIIITGVGKEVITDQNIKKGVVLLNFGLRNIEVLRDGVRKTKLSGDYDEEKIKHIAGLYTKTPGGLGPIDVLCLLGNLLESASNYGLKK